MRAVQINDDTYVPVAWLGVISVFLLTTVAGGVFWLATLHSDVAQGKAYQIEDKIDKRQMFRMLQRFERNQTRIMEHMHIQPERADDGD